MFKVGDTVEWSSQSGGYTEDKRGVVAAVVPVGGRPDRDKFWRLYRGTGPGYSRDHVSYVVLVGKRPYWPRVCHLRAAHSAEAQPAQATNSRYATALEVYTEWLNGGLKENIFDRWCRQRLNAPEPPAHSA